MPRRARFLVLRSLPFAPPQPAPAPQPPHPSSPVADPVRPPACAHRCIRQRPGRKVLLLLGSSRVRRIY
uniref:Uncharacterized protein n=1 Tax=Arundo donax TaxID=35708 RepID=A0A0A9B6P3_ARUDO